MFAKPWQSILRCFRSDITPTRRPKTHRPRPTIEVLESRLAPAAGGGDPTPPTAVDDSLAYIIDTSTPLNVFENDIEPNAGATLDPATITIVTQPAFGLLVHDPSTGMLLYTPNYLLPPGLPPGEQPPDPQQDSFVYTIRNSLGLESNQATVTLPPVGPVEEAPIVPADDFAQTKSATPIAIDVTRNDDVRDGSAADLSSIRVITPASHGTVSVNLTTGIATYAPNFGFIGFDSFVYEINTTASEIRTDGQVFIAVSAAPPRLVADPLGGKMLVIDGTLNNDTILVDRGVKAKDVIVWINGVKSGPFQPTSRIVTFGYHGDDALKVSKKVTLPAWLYGGAGNDKIEAGGGPGVLFGDAGNDILLGGAKRDLLFGGGGADVIFAKPGDDLLVAGDTTFNNSQTALAGVFQEWNSGRSYKQRVQNLTGQVNGSFAKRKNGAIFLNAATVLDDGATDVIVGGKGKDLSFAGLFGDTVIGKRKGETLFVA